MKNWSGSVQWQPLKVLKPKTESEIIDCVNQAITQHSKIRIIGSGHSFTALCKTNELLVSLDNYQGLISVDKAKCQATVKGGTKLNVLGDLLFAQGLAMENLGDIDKQSIAGTISTGTHGTGKAFGTISTQVIALKFVNGKGELVECSQTKNVELFKALQVSLGAFGIITEITLQCVPAYKLKLQNKKEDINDVLTTINQRITENRNFEFYWIPYTNTAWTKTSNIVKNEEPDKVNVLNYYTEYILENYIFKCACEIASWFPKLNRTVANITSASINNVKKVYYSHKVYATQRLVKFHEMEYNIPAESYNEVINEVMQIVNSKAYNIHFPIENRWVKGDDIWLSPAYGRDSVYMACHVYYKKEYKAYFKALEDVFKRYNGRPHWGKMNTLTSKDISRLYPKYEDFMTLRNTHDPDQIFINDYLKQLLFV